MSARQHRANPLCQTAGSFIDAPHVSSCAQDQQRLTFLSPRRLIPRRLLFPPVLYCRGTSPTDAAKSRLHPYCLPSPISAASALAVIGPTPGMLETLSDIVVSELTRQFFVNFTDLFVEVLEMFMQAFESCNQTGRQFMPDEHGRQTHDSALTHR